MLDIFADQAVTIGGTKVVVVAVLETDNGGNWTLFCSRDAGGTPGHDVTVGGEAVLVVFIRLDNDGPGNNCGSVLVPVDIGIYVVIKLGLRMVVIRLLKGED